MPERARIIPMRDLPLTMSRLPSLNAIRCFSVAARLQSFTAAADELHVTQGAVSRLVQSLEQELGVQLFTRNGRFITLTAPGARFHEEVSGALDRIWAASNRVRQSVQEEALSVAVSSGFATRWLVPRLPNFQRSHPLVRVTILANERDEQALANRVHVRIRYGSGPWPGYVAGRLPVSASVGVVCAPALYAPQTLRGPADLLTQPLIAYMGESRDLWGEYFRHFELEPPDLSQVTRFHQLLMLTEAAVSGMGFALVPLFLVESELASGRLVQAIPQTVVSARGYFVLHQKGEEADHRVQAFRNWLLAPQP